MFDKSPNAFTFRGLEQLKKEIERLGLDIPVADEIKDKIHLLKQSLNIDGVTVPNRFCIQPMEGCDGDSAGNPGELTMRKYIRFARGGAGMIWVEATAVVPEGRANPRQLLLNRDTAPKFKELADTIRNNSFNENGQPQRPYLILQLTHSGRYSKPEGKPSPMIFHHSPVLDPTHNLDESYPLVSDEYLDQLQDRFIEAARLARECGYDAVDIKSTHGYLLHEILSAHTRTDSKYGGSFENRISMLTGIAKRIRDEVPGIAITSRLNVYDAYPYPFGWGMKTDGSMDPDLSEPLKLIGILKGLGVKMLNIAFGNPYYNPNIERPYDFPSQGISIPEEHPLTAVERMIKLTGDIAAEYKDMIFTSVGFTWLRELFPNVCISALESGKCQVVGVGRAALAYPDFANDLFKKGFLAKEKTCITCSSCTQIMRDGGMAGCVIRDAGVYRPIYREGRLRNEIYVRMLSSGCRSCWGAACMGGCPAGVDVPGFIKAFYEGDVKKSYEILKESNILAEACAYTCPAEEQCEKSCTSGLLDDNTVPVHTIQKFVAEEARKKGWTRVKAGAPNGRKVAVIGFGPAGIACSVHLVENGCNVTVFEASDRPGGTATAVIPYERLRKNILEEEVRAFGLEETGRFEVKYGTTIGSELSLDDLTKQGYDAVFVGAGLTENTGLPFENKPQGVYSALEFLNDIKKGSIKLFADSKAAVIGGGNTAMDAAVSLRHAGVRDVYLIYRRSFKELPAWEREVEKAQKEGVHFLILNQPVGYIEKNGKLAALKLAHTQLGEPDASGRPSPVILPDSGYEFPVSICIEATGQSVSPELVKGLQGVEFEKGRIKRPQSGYQTTRSSVYAGGDIVNGGMTVVQAVKEGLEAAKEILGKF